MKKRLGGFGNWRICKSISMEKLIIFDLDGTLAESKSPIDAKMETLLNKLLHRRKSKMGC
jgi:ribonucleotide monophosphatase NagD (HAD superfamily)